MLTCSCGTSVWIDVHPFTIMQGAFRVWTLKDKLVAEARSIPAVICARCSRMYLPATSLAGKNALDPEVQLYKNLLALSEERNARIDLLDKMFIREIENGFRNGEETPTALVGFREEVSQEEERVTAAKPGRKPTKKPA